MIRKLRVGITKKIFPRPIFEAILKKHLPQNDVNLVMLAYRLAKRGHKGQERDDHSRYFDHPKSSALIIMLELGIFTPRMIIAALLHDIEEGAFILKSWDIERIFGKRVRKAVETMTKEKGKDYFDGLKKVVWWVKLVKLADRLHNLRTLLVFPTDKRIRYLQETNSFYIPLAEQLIRDIPRKYRKKAAYLLEEIKWACQKVERTLK